MISRAAAWLSQLIANRRQRTEVLRTVRATKARLGEALANPDLSSLERLIIWWNEGPCPGPSDAQLTALESRYSLRLPEDFRAYLKAVMPNGNDWDPEGTRWWPLADIKSVREECTDWESDSVLDSEKLIIFADYLIWCYAWAIDCSETENRGKIALITGDDHYVANSFDDFLDRYLRNDLSLHQ